MAWSLAFLFFCLSSLVTATWRWPNHPPLLTAHYPPAPFLMHPSAATGMLQPSPGYSLHHFPMHVNNVLGPSQGGRPLKYSIDKFDSDDRNLIWTPSQDQSRSAYMDMNIIRTESMESSSTESNRPLIEVDRAAMSNTSYRTSLAASGRTTDALTPSRLMLYEAPPSYDRILLPPPSILVTSRPLPMSAHVGRDRLPMKGHVSLLPAANVILRPSVPLQNWSSLTSLKMSLRPDGWTKAAKPARVSEAMRFFLPELKYYSGVKSIDASRVNSTVEKYVLVQKKESNDVLSPFPVTNNLIVQEFLPGHQDQEQNQYINQLLDRDERKFPNPMLQPQDADFDATTESSDLTTSDLGPRLSHKSIKDIVEEVFATALPIPDQEESDIQTDNETIILADEREAEEALQTLFDILHLNMSLSTLASEMELNDQNKSNSRWQKMKQLTPSDVVHTEAPITNPAVEIETESHPSFLSNFTVRFEVSPPDAAKVTQEMETSTESNSFTNVNSIIDFVSSATTTTTTTSSTAASGANRCQGLWCYHNAALTSDATSASVAKTTEMSTILQTEGNSDGDRTTNHVDPLLSYLGLAWPQFMPDLTTTTTSTMRPVTKPVTPVKARDPRLESHKSSNNTLTAHVSSTTTSSTDIQVPNSIASRSNLRHQISTNTSVKPKPGGRRNSVHSMGQPEELLGLPNKALDTKFKRFSRKEMASMVGALGHGIQQVMGIVMPLIDMGAPPPKLDFSSFKSRRKR